MILTYLFCLILLIYVLFIAALKAGWRRLAKSNDAGTDVPDRLISVIIPFRNEELNLPGLLQDLVAQDYPNEKVEIILVDDHSTDQSAKLVREWIETAKTDSRLFSLSDFPTYGHGKKGAITLGVEKAGGEIICMTDADCRLSTQWISLYNKEFTNDWNFVAGPVRYFDGKNWFSRVQSIELAALTATSSALGVFGMPTMCNGANIGFRKSSFEQVGGYQGNILVPSGDDLFLMHEIHKLHPGSVKYAVNNDLIVSTRANADLGELFHQRRRWAGKWRYYRSPATLLLAFFVFSIYTMLFAGVAATAIGMMNPLILVTGLFLKTGVEFAFLSGVTRDHKVGFRIVDFLSLQIIYPLYVVIVGLASNFGKYNWKGRTLSRKAENIAFN